MIHCVLYTVVVRYRTRNLGLSCKVPVLTVCSVLLVFSQVSLVRCLIRVLSCLVKGSPPRAYMLFYMLFCFVLLRHVSHVLNYSFYLPSTARQHAIPQLLGTSVSRLMQVSCILCLLKLISYTYVVAQILSNSHCTYWRVLYLVHQLLLSRPVTHRHEVSSTPLRALYHGIHTEQGLQKEHDSK